MKIRLLTFALLFSVIPGLFAQEYRGTLSGSVSDQHGAAIAKTKIVVTATRTGVKSETVSEESGAYTIPFLLPGEYEITGEAPGFKKFVRQGVTISNGDHPVIDIKLSVGDVAESVTVTADAPLIESANGSVGQVITTSEVEDFPVNGRSPIMLANLALGVVSTFEPGPATPSDHGGPTNMSIGGAPSGTSDSLINGSPNTNFANQPSYAPPQDAVLEVRVNSFSTDASSGHSLGGTTNLITKGGTNGLHGSAYEFNQSSKYNANTFFNNKNGILRPSYVQNQTGFTVGGPFLIPKIYNGRNRVFWFFAGEKYKSAVPQNSPSATSNPVYYATVPTPAERQGDFSALLKAGANYAIYDPTTGVVSGTQVQRSVFPNNVIPTSRLNPVALNYLKYYPQPDTAGRIDGFQNKIVNAVGPVKFTNELGRLDFNLSNRNKLYYDFRHTERFSSGPFYLGYNNIASGATGANRVNWGTTLDDVYTLTPNTVMNMRLNWSRFVQFGGTLSDGFDPTQLGFPAYILNNSQSPRMPYVTFGSTGVVAGSIPSFQYLGASVSRAINSADSFQLFTDVVKVHGNHTIKAGTDIREYRWSAFSSGNSAGTYNFTPNWTVGPFTNSPASPLGQDFASFLLGLPTTGSYDVNAQSTLTSRYYSLFVQEDWRARSNLTVNVGLRWEMETPSTERYNRAVNGFDSNAVNSASAAAAAAYAANPIPQVPVSQFKALGGVTYASASQPDVYHVRSSIFSPRVGFAWTPKALGSRTVIRGGFGIFVGPVGILGNSSVGFNNGTPALRQPGFSQTTQFVATNDNYLTPAATLSNPYPAGIVPPAGSSRGASTFLGQQVNFFNPDIKNPYALRWNFGVQHQLPFQMMLEVAYIGNHAVGLLVTSTNLNYVPRQYLSTSPVRDQNTINLLGSSVTNPFRGLLPNSASLNGATVPLQQLLLRYPQFPAGGVVMDMNGAGGSYYESLNVRLQKRFTNGLTLLSNFVWNKLIDRLVYLNDSDPEPEKRTSGDSRPLREVVAATYRLPIGRGQRLDLHSRVLNGVAGGWAVNAIATVQLGPQLSWGNVIYYGGDINLNTHTPDGPAFDTTRFNKDSAQQLASNVRTFNTLFNKLRRDTTKNLDLSLLKEIGLGERKYLQLRGEFYNSTNRVTFNVPNTTPTSTAFGIIAGQGNTERRIQLAARVVW